MDDYGSKLLTSGYERGQVMKIVINGIKGFLSKRSKWRANGSLRIHRTVDESKFGRIKRKMIGKASWYMKSEEGWSSLMGRVAKTFQSS